MQQPLLARCGGITWPLFALSAPRVDDMLVLDPAPAVPIEFRRGDSETWSSAVVMPPDRSSAEVVVMLP